MTTATAARDVPRDVITLALRHVWTEHPRAYLLPVEDRQQMVRFEQDADRWLAYCLHCPTHPPT